MPATAPRVGLFVTCLVDLYRPQAGFAAVKLLEDAGCIVEVPAAQTCCGQPGLNSGDAATARDLARRVVATFRPYEHVVVLSGSCAGTIRRHYPELFADDPEMRRAVRALAARTYELVEYLVDVRGLTAVEAAFGGRVAHHLSCSALRELGMAGKTETLLDTVSGLDRVSLAHPEECCGFGGTFCVKYPDISERMATGKVQDIHDSGAEIVASGDLGCLLNIIGRAQRMDVPLKGRHVAEVLAGDVASPPLGEDEED